MEHLNPEQLDFFGSLAQAFSRPLNTSSTKAAAEQGTGMSLQESGKQATRQEATPGLEQTNQSEDSIKQEYNLHK